MKTLEKAKEYRDALCNVLEISIEELHSGSRKQPLPLKRQIVSVMIYNRYRKSISMKSIGMNLINYNFDSAHSVISYNIKTIKNLVDSGHKKTIQVYDKAVNFDQLYDQCNMYAMLDRQDTEVMRTEAVEPVYIPNPKATMIGEIYRKKLTKGMYLVWGGSLFLCGLMALQIVVK